jgi:hypothetical protein
MLRKVFVPILFFTLLISFVIFRSSLEAEDKDTSAPDNKTLEDKIKKEGDPTAENSEEELKSVEDKIKKEEFRINSSKSMLPFSDGDYLRSLIKRKEELMKTEKK